MQLNKNYKSFARAYKIYQDMLKKDEILPIKEIDDLGKYFGKKGAPLKKKTTSEKSKREFNEALRAYNRRFGTGAGARLKREAKSQVERIAKTVNKKKPYSEFEIKARQEVQKRREMVKAFASANVANLRDKLNIGSDVILYLATEKGFTEKMIENYISNMEREFAMLTPQAREIADADTMNQALKDLSDYYGRGEIGSVLEAYLRGVDNGDVDGTLDAFDYYFTRQEQAKFSFDDFMEELASYGELNEKNFEEVFENLKGEE